jgi:signal transduction histidine kinase
MKKFKLSLRTEIIINMTILMLAMIILISILVILISKKDIYLKKAEGSLELVQALSNMVAPVINISSDLKSDITKRKELEGIVKKFFTNLQNINIIIADKKGKIYYNYDKSSKKDRIDDEKFFELLKLKIPATLFKEVEKKILRDTPKKLFVYSPIMKDDEATGGIIAEFSLSRERYYAARSQSLILLSIALDAVMFIIFGSLLLSRVIVKPIKKLVGATEKIASGNLNFKVEPFPTKEIDRLSESFNQMTKKLLRSKEHLQEHVDSLEKVNKELKQAKDEVLRQEKLASVGRLAAGIAHEVGNPLGSIIGYLEILTESKGADLDDYIKRIQRECYRIDVIVRELLDYSKKHKFLVEQVNLNELIQETCGTTFHRKMFSNIVCEKELGASIPDVMVDKMQIQQVITNLLINSADSMKSGGSIHLSTKSTKYRQNMFASTKLKEGDKLVCLSIHDTGTGIRQKDLGKIFDPFYTTKEPGKGTGLGLAISLRIVESFDGAITVKSKKGTGTAFNIYLPVRD